MKILYRKKEIFDSKSLKELNKFIKKSDYDLLKNIYKIKTFDKTILLSDQTIGIRNFISLIPKFKNNVPITMEYWLERGWSEKEAENITTKYKIKISRGIKAKIPKEKRIEYARNANKKRIKQIRKLQEDGEYNKTNPTSIEYYLNKGMTQEEAEQALKERQSTFSKKKLIKKYGEEEGIKKLQERNEKWLSSLKENNDWDELSKSKSFTLKSAINKYGEEEGTEKYYNWKNAIAQTKINFINRHGEKEGIKKWKQFKSQRNKLYGSSKEANHFFKSVINKIKNSIDVTEIYMDDDNSKEYWLKHNNKTFFYDFTIRNLNVIIEYHGDHIHPNPKWNEEKWNKWRHCYNKKNADEMRIFDKQKKSLAESQGFKVLEIWNDDDFESNIQKSINFILNQLT